MPLLTVRNDITTTEVDAIVNAANKSLLGGGGVDGAIHKAAGKGLLEECKTLGGCNTGEAKITKGYNLPCKYVIHTVGPIYKDGKQGEREMLESCYKESLLLAKEKGLGSIAFPLISAGAYGYPTEEALRVANDTIIKFLENNDDMTVYIVIFDKKAHTISKELFDEISEYIDDNYTREYEESAVERRRRRIRSEERSMCYNAPSCAEPVMLEENLDDMLENLDESFSEMLLRKIDEKGMTDIECYKRANIDRKLFSKIKSNKLYHPTKRTAIAFAIALCLSLEETRELLLKAGFALSKSNKFDVIIEYFIVRGNYNVFEINEALFAFDQALLGA